MFRVTGTLPELLPPAAVPYPLNGGVLTLQRAILDEIRLDKDKQRLSTEIAQARASIAAGKLTDARAIAGRLSELYPADQTVAACTGLLSLDEEEARWQRRVHRQTFLGYYNRELTYLRQLGAEFKKNHPAVASRLRLDADQCDDPHVERMLESFAFLAARIHLRIDDEFPEIAGALLEELYPNFARPVPSFSLVEFLTDPEHGKQTTGRRIPNGTMLQSNPFEGFVCRFRTCFETQLWPLTLESAAWRSSSNLPPALLTRPTAAVLELKLNCSPDVVFPELGLSSLRFYLQGGSDLVFPLYELLLSRCHSVYVQDNSGSNAPKLLTTGSITPGGFADSELLCRESRNRRSFSGYQLLEDYFSFPEKYLFLDFNGLEAIGRSGIARSATLLCLISPFERQEWRSVLEQNVSAKTFRLNCSPIVNLFQTSSDPIPIRSNVSDMPVPSGSRTEIYSIDSVYGLKKSSADKLQFDRYIDCGRGETNRDTAGYWSAVRRPSRTEENTSEMFLNLFNQTGEQISSVADSLTARITCTNKDWPFRLPMNHPRGDFYVEEHPEVTKVVCLRPPTKGFPAPSSLTSLWRLLSQLSLNHLSLVEGGRSALQCILRIHSLGESDFAEENIAGIRGLSSQPHFARVSSEHGMAFVRGKRVEITVDEKRFAGSGAFLFGSVLERFLGLYTSLNSFSLLSLKSDLRGDKPIHKWPARSGAKVVL